MKYFNKFLVLFFLLTCIVGCKKTLDLKPPMTQTQGNFYRNQTEAFQALTSVYNILTWSAPSTASGSPQNCAFEVISEIMSDECYGGGANAGDIPTTIRLQRFQAYVNDPAPEALWKKYYTGIYRANLFLSKIDNIPFDTTSLQPMYKAEAQFLRANFYFDLVRLFGHVPLILSPLTTADITQNNTGTTDAVYEQIAKDLVDAIHAKTSNGNYAMQPSSASQIATDKGRATRAAAEALLARVWLYYTGYYGKTQLGTLTSTDMITYIEDVVNNSGNTLMSNAYDTTDIIRGTKKGISPLFAVPNKNNVEGVFEIQYSSLSKWGDWNKREGCMGNQAIVLWGIRDIGGTYAAGWSFAPVNTKLFNIYPAGDKRRMCAIINANKSTIVGDDGEGLTYTQGYQNTGYFCRKFTPLVANNANAGSRELNYANNYPLIRFADVLLMATELQFLYGDKNTAANYYNLVRKRAIPTATGETANSLTIDKIFEERRLELALEGHRYWDILRRGQDYAASILTNGESGEFAVIYDRIRAGLLPIPQYDIIQSNYSLKQNPGY